MSTKDQVQKLKPGEFKFQPSSDWVVLEVIHIESKEERKAKLSGINIIPAGAPKNIIDLQNQASKESVSYSEYIKDAVGAFDGKHGFQGIVKAIGPLVDPEIVNYKVGDKVYHRGRSGEPMVHNKRLFWLLKPHEIYGKAPRYEHEV